VTSSHERIHGLSIRSSSTACYQVRPSITIRFSGGKVTRFTTHAECRIEDSSFMRNPFGISHIGFNEHSSPPTEYNQMGNQRFLIYFESSDSKYLVFHSNSSRKRSVLLRGEHGQLDILLIQDVLPPPIGLQHGAKEELIH